MKHIFEIFYRGDASRNRGGLWTGTGIVPEDCGTSPLKALCGKLLAGGQYFFLYNSLTTL